MIAEVRFHCLLEGVEVLSVTVGAVEEKGGEERADATTEIFDKGGVRLSGGGRCTWAPRYQFGVEYS